VGLTILQPSVTRLSSENVATSTSHNPIGLHSLCGTVQYGRYALTFQRNHLLSVSSVKDVHYVTSEKTFRV
jgi:hypothetical protein